MRSNLFWVLFLGVATACTSIPRRASLDSSYHAACSLVPVRGITIAHTQLQQATRDFAQQQGYPYSLLYVETHAGSGPSGIICVRLVQQAGNQFTYYTYRNQQVRKSAVTNPVWEQSLAAVGHGHFMGVCDNDATEPVEGILQVKRDTAVIFSLSVSLHERDGFSGLDKERVDAALKLIGSITNREY
jgi:hypothetical protein